VSARAHPRAVGAFVLVAIALVLAVVVVLSSGTWFAPRDHFVVFFPGSVRGLNPGAPVTFRGVQVGQVRDVTAFLTGKPDPMIQIEVEIEFRRTVIEAPEGVVQPWARLRGAELARRLIASGIRARLLSQSLLTGQKYIDFDFLPDEPARFSGIPRRYPELPTTPTALERLSQRSEELMQKIADLPIDQVVEEVRKFIQSVNRFLASPELERAIRGTSRAAEALRPTMEELRTTMADLRRVSQSLDTSVGSTSSETAETARRLRSTLDRLDRTLGRIDQTALATDETRVHAAETLDDLSRTLASLRALAEYIQTHPEAMVLGKARPEAPPRSKPKPEVKR
jgi:paraquat-inducible protein B